MGPLRSMLAVVVLLGLAAGGWGATAASSAPATTPAISPASAATPSASSATTATSNPAAAAASPQPAAVVQLFGEIDDYSRDALFRRFAAARAAGAKTIILEENTP